MSQQPYYSQSAYPGSPYIPGSRATGDPGLNLPWYGIGFGQAVKRVFSKYATFSGRASQGEFWWFYLFNAIIGLGISVLILVAGINWSYLRYSYSYHGYYSYYGPFDFLNGFGTFMYGVDIVYGLAVLVPSLAVAVRRLHDINKSGAWWCVIFIPIAGPVWWLILMATETYPGVTQWDPPAQYAQHIYQPPTSPEYPPQGFTPQGYPQGFTPQAPYPPSYPPQGSPYPPNYPPAQPNPPQDGWR